MRSLSLLLALCGLVAAAAASAAAGTKNAESEFMGQLASLAGLWGCGRAPCKGALSGAL